MRRHFLNARKNRNFRVGAGSLRVKLKICENSDAKARISPPSDVENFLLALFYYFEVRPERRAAHRYPTRDDAPCARWRRVSVLRATLRP